MKYYVNLSAIKNTINYFRNIDYSKPEQIGLFLYFKKAGLHSFGYEKYKKWGDFDSPEREGYLRNLYDLAGIFDETCENPLKYTALFPFSITNYYKSLSYYNGGSPFKTLGSRISDTLDNSLVSTIIQRDVNDKNNLMFNADYLNIIKNKQLKGHLIPLTAIASWCYRFYAVEMPEGFLEKDFTDVLILAFLMEYNISYKEFTELFSFDSRPIDHSETMVTAAQLRDLLGVKNGDCTPEIQDGGVVDFMPIMRTLSLNTVNKLLDQRGSELTKERIEAILRDRDEKIKKECDLASRTEIERAILECWEKKDFNYEPHIEQLYSEFNKLFGKEALKSFSDSRELLTMQCNTPNKTM